MQCSHPRRVVAAASAGLAAVAGLVALGPAATADTVKPTVTCVLPAGQGTFTGPQDVTVTLDKTVVAPGGQITGSVTLGESPAKSTVGMTIYATPSITLGMKGAATGEVTVTGTEQTIAAEKDKPVPIAPYSGKFSVPVSATAGGRIDFTVLKMVTNTTLTPGGAIFPTECTVNSGGDTPVAAVAVEGGAAEQATLTAPGGDIRPGAALTLTGTGYTPKSVPEVSLCNGDGTGCSAPRFTTNTLNVDAEGGLSGTATLAKTGLPDGTYLVQVIGGAKQARAAITIKSFAPVGAPRAYADISAGPLGTVVTVHGDNWRPYRNINIATLGPDDELLMPVTNVNADAEGVLAPAQLVVTDPYSTKIQVRGGSSTTEIVLLPFTLTGANEVPPVVGPNPTGLTMTQSGSGVAFGSATLNGESQTLTAALNQVQVTDGRGGNLGWSLTGTMTDLLGENGTDKIPAANLSWTPSCAAAPGNLSGVVNGPAGALGAAPATLCTGAANGAPTGGTFTADAQLTLATPQFIAAGTYSGTLILTLA